MSCVYMFMCICVLVCITAYIDMNKLILVDLDWAPWPIIEGEPFYKQHWLAYT